MNRFLVCLLIWTPLFAAAETADLKSEIDAAVTELIEKKRLAGGCVLVSKDGKILHKAAYGLADVETEKPMRTDTIFRIYSFSKSITTAAALMSLDEGKFKPDDPVANWIPAFKNREDLAKITVADLMRHTAGFGYGKQYDDADIWSGDLEDLADRIATVPLIHEPSAKWNYGLAIDVLGRLVEIWNEKPLADVLAERVFEPLGMEDTAFYIEEQRRDQLATMYNRKDEGLAVHDDERNRFEPPKAPSGGGGLLSTIDDYHRFLTMIINNGKAPDGQQLLKPETVALMLENQLPDGIDQIAFGDQKRFGVGFTFGFSVVTEKRDEWDPNDRVGEVAWGGLPSCHYWMLPKEKLIVITLEQTLPYDWDLENAIKPIVYRSLGIE